MIQREKKDKVRVGYVALGTRGYSMLSRCFGKMKDVEIAWVCDKDEQKIEKTLKFLQDEGRPAPKTTTDYRDILADPEVDAVINMSGWDMHVKITVEAMYAGKYVAVEVGGAYDLSECYEVVDAYEKTGVPVMMLENCCYGRREMMALRMVKEGLFGEVLHCDGGYMHCLNRGELFVGEDKKCFRGTIVLRITSIEIASSILRTSSDRLRRFLESTVETVCLRFLPLQAKAARSRNSSPSTSIPHIRSKTRNFSRGIW